MMPADAESHAFVVRIWEERREIADAPAIWRGFVCDVRNGTRVYFTTLPTLCAYLAGQTGITGNTACGPGGDRDEPRDARRGGSP
jgi:hypothetical protein